MAAKKAAERFAASVRLDGRTGCWVWEGVRDDNGYGRIKVRGRQMRAHRFSWEQTNGPAGRALVLHRCDNRACVRPSHLFLGTNADNMADKAAKGRSARGELNPGAKLTAEKVRKIRVWALAGVPQRFIARHFRVTVDQVSNVARRRHWRHVA